jgi:hypothetical protein
MGVVFKLNFQCTSHVPLIEWLFWPVVYYQDEKYLHPKEVLITDYLRETVLFNQEKAVTLRSGKKMSEALDGVFRGIIK